MIQISSNMMQSTKGDRFGHIAKEVPRSVPDIVAAPSECGATPTASCLASAERVFMAAISARHSSEVECHGSKLQGKEKQFEL